MKLESEQFKNSDSCEVVSYAHEKAEHDIAIAYITGRYPDIGWWAVNEESDEMVAVIEGKGRLFIKDNAAIELAVGDGAFVPAGSFFAWDGTMTLSISCNPKFDPNKYKMVEA